MAINKPDFLAGYSLFYESARYGADFLAAIEINRDLLAHARTSPSRRAGTQSPSLRDLLALARTSPSRRAGTQSPSLRDLLTSFAHPPAGGPAHNPPLSGICSLTLAHPPAACGGAGQISKKHHRVNSWCFLTYLR